MINIGDWARNLLYGEKSQDGQKKVVNGLEQVVEKINQIRTTPERLINQVAQSMFVEPLKQNYESAKQVLQNPKGWVNKLTDVKGLAQDLNNPELQQDMMNKAIQFSAGVRAVPGVSKPLIAAERAKDILAKQQGQVNETMFDLQRAIKDNIDDIHSKALKGDKYAIEDYGKLLETQKALEAGKETTKMANEAREILKFRNIDTGVPVKPPVEGGVSKVYHGTNSDFKTFREPSFNVETQDTSTAFGRGVYTTDNAEYAKNFGKNVKEINIPKNAKFFELKDTKYRLTDIEAKRINTAIKKLGVGDLLQKDAGYRVLKKGDLATVIFDDLRSATDTNTITDILKEAGYDGVKYQEIPLTTAFSSNPKKYGNKTDYVLFSHEMANKGLAQPAPSVVEGGVSGGGKKIKSSK